MELLSLFELQRHWHWINALIEPLLVEAKPTRERLKQELSKAARLICQLILIALNNLDYCLLRVLHTSGVLRGALKLTSSGTRQRSLVSILSSRLNSSTIMFSSRLTSFHARLEIWLMTFQSIRLSRRRKKLIPQRGVDWTCPFSSHPWSRLE